MSSHIATLAIDLSALRANYRLLKAKHAKGALAAVVKANAYGLGVETVSKTLWEEGCRQFFVATLAEGIELRECLPQAQIGVFNGLLANEEKDFAQHRLTPVLNDLGQVNAWVTGNGQRATDGTIALHVDTGITRLGLHQADLQALSSRIPYPATRILLMSHLACAHDRDHPKNAEQLARFKQALALFPGAAASLANSAGIFLPPEYHFDVARPGCALYGIHPTGGDNPMRHVATLSAPMLQIRTLAQDETVGYGATYSAKKGSRIALVGLGYSDGYFRALGNRGFAYVAGMKVPIAGRISMDMIALDVSALSEAQLTPDLRAEFINAQQTVNAIADQCDTIGYEIFSRIGRRVKRVYG
jgi:alanine racemase